MGTHTLPNLIYVAIGLGTIFASLGLSWPIVWPVIQWLGNEIAGPGWTRKSGAPIVVFALVFGALLLLVSGQELIGRRPFHLRADDLPLLLLVALLFGLARWYTYRGHVLSDEDPPGFHAFANLSAAAIARWWHWIAIPVGLALAVVLPRPTEFFSPPSPEWRLDELQSRLWGFALLATGVVVFGFRLFRNSQPFPAKASHYVRPVGQMMIATFANVLLATVPSASAIAAGMAINATHPERAPIGAWTLALAAGLFALQAIALPLHAWWRWFGERNQDRDAHYAYTVEP